MTSRRSARAACIAVATSLLGIFAAPHMASADGLTVNVKEGTTNLSGAFVALVNSTTGAAIDAAISSSNGNVSLDSGVTALGSTKLLITKPGYSPSVVTSVSATNAVVLSAVTSSSIRLVNAFGAQTRRLAADLGESGVFYATTDNNPSLWRTTDYAGTWAPVPTSAESASTGIPQGQQANRVISSGVAGEVAVSIGSNNDAAIWFSRDYGTSWTKVLNTPSGGPNGIDDFHWAHSGTSSYMLIKGSSSWSVAFMNATSPSFATWTLPSGVSVTDNVALVAGSQVSNRVYLVSVPQNGTAATSTLLAAGASTTAGLTSTQQDTLTGVTVTNAGTPGDLVLASTLGGAELRAVVVYDLEGSQGASSTLKASLISGSAGSYSLTVTNAIKGTTSSQDLSSWGTRTFASGYCGENGGGPVGSLAPTAPPAGSPSSTEPYKGFSFVGTIRQCFFAVNLSGGSLNLAGSQAVANQELAVLPMNGANNNTGFAFDAGFNFNDNFVALSGDGQYGIRKSANLATGSRPTFGQAGVRSVDSYVTGQAAAGAGTATGGIAVNGLTNPVVRDTVYSPNVTDGSTYMLSTAGGSRVLLTTDSGQTFSTVGAGGSEAIDWWNGDGRQWIAAAYGLQKKSMFRVKHFTSDNGTTKTQMGEELAATADQRDSRSSSALRFELEELAPKLAPATCFGMHNFVYEGSSVSCSSGDPSNDLSLTALQGVTGKNLMFAAVSKSTSPTSGTVALISMTPNAGDSSADWSSVRYFGSQIDESGTTSDAQARFGGSSLNATYEGSVKSIAYCPTGSAADVADKAFIAVEGKGMYVIEAVTTNPKHKTTGTTTGTINDLKVDCDSGLMVAASSTGPQFSLNASTFVAMQLPTPTQNVSAIDVQSNPTTGDVTVVVGTERSDVVAVNTTLSKLGTNGTEMLAGTAANPSTPVAITASEASTLNNASQGQDVGAIQDVELPAESTDKVRAAGVRSAADIARSMSVGTAGGAFRARTTATSSGTGGGSSGSTTATTTPTATTVTPVVVKTPTVKRGKTLTVVSALKTAGTTVIKGSKTKVVVASASKKICSATSTTIKGLKAGNCSLTVTVTPAKVTKRTNTTVTKGQSLTIASIASTNKLPSTTNATVKVTVSAGSKRVCTVSANKTVKAIGSGKCTLTISVTGKKFTKKLLVKVS